MAKKLHPSVVEPKGKHAKLIRAARRLYEPANAGALDVYPDAKVSRAEHGWWVQAWVYVHDEEIK